MIAYLIHIIYNIELCFFNKIRIFGKQLIKRAYMTTENLVQSILNASWGIYLAFTFIFIFMKIPKRKSFAPYKRSRVFMVFAYFFLFLQIFIGWMLPKNSISPEVLAAIDTPFFYIELIFLCLAFFHLLDHSFGSFKRILLDLSSWCIVCFACITSLTIKNHTIQIVLVLFSSFMLACFTTICVLRFIRIYKVARVQLSNYYTDQMYYFVLWIRRSITYIAIFGIVSFVVLFAPYTFRVVYFLAATIMNVYIAKSFINYSFVFEEVEHSLNLSFNQQILLRNPQTHKSNDTKADILSESQKGLMRIWLSNEKYCNSDLTIDSVAREIKTNRSYLSRYINETYNSNFSNWISSLRIRKAKQIMQSDTTLTIEEVAYKVGFSSSSYFIQIFLRLEGVTPFRWLKTQQRI